MQLHWTHFTDIKLSSKALFVRHVCYKSPAQSSKGHTYRKPLENLSKLISQLQNNEQMWCFFTPHVYL